MIPAAIVVTEMVTQVTVTAIFVLAEKEFLKDLRKLFSIFLSTGMMMGAFLRK
jgi:hypothetical protein